MASYTEWDRLVGLFRKNSPNIAKAFDEAKKHSIRQDAELTALASASTPGSSIRPWPEKCIWYTPLPASPSIHANSAAMISDFLANGLVNASTSPHYFGCAVVRAKAGDPTYTFTCNFNPSCNVNSLGQVPVPAGTLPDPSSDGHLTIYSLEQNLVWEFWIYYSPGSCENGGVRAMTGHGGGDNNGSAGMAARTPMLPVLLTPSEVAAGIAQHALVCSFHTNGVKNTHVFPATAGDGAQTRANACPEGTWFQLDPSINVDALAIQPWEKAIARTMQKYGLVLVDKGGAFTIKCQSFPGTYPGAGDPWAAVGMGAEYPAFSGAFPFSSLRVLNVPSTTYPYFS